MSQGLRIIQVAAVSLLVSGLAAWDLPAEEVAPASSLAYYLPADTADYDPEIPTPESVLGWQVGEWHVRHDQLARYFETLAGASGRVTLREIGRSHEHRPLLHATITSERNLARLDEIKKAHGNLISGGDVDLDDLPVLVNLGYSVHGNEASGSNASMLTAYHLAAARDKKTLELLENVVVVIDPSLNPDGLARFATWANMHRGKVPVADRNNRDHLEGWPNGRTNHYWFDLNRDWLLAQHPESQARLAAFHGWMPHVLADFHEMGSEATYFFQPGVPERKNPLTPDRNVELTAAFAKRHAAALDEIGSLYYSEESFDDFYYGKGSTYPDVHGAVGILFEQASARGHAQESEVAAGGRFTFSFAIRNQLTTSFSTLQSAHELRQELLEYRRQFFAESKQLSADDSRRALIVGEAGDAMRTARFAQVLAANGVWIHRVAGEATVDAGDYQFDPASALVVPLDQPQYRLIRALFDTTQEFQDATFYDVSTWTLPLAFDLPVAVVDLDQAGARLQPTEIAQLGSGARFVNADSANGWAFQWSPYFAARSLYRLLDAGVRAQVALQPFVATTEAGPRSFDRGTVFIPKGLQTLPLEGLAKLLEEIASVDGVPVASLTSGLTPDGIDLGSPNFRPLKKPRPALVVGDGVSTYEAGETWHLLDHRFAVETTLLERSRLRRVDLDRYTHLIFVSGRWHEVDETTRDKLRRWLEGGGVLVTAKEAALWAEKEYFERPEPVVEKTDKPQGKKEPAKRRAYGDAQQDAAVSLIGGAIFEVEVDRTHPLAFGLTRDLLPVFKDSQLLLEAPDDPYVTVAAYSKKPRISGYASDDNINRLAGTPAVIARKVGRGTVVQMANNPNFRAFWYGTSRWVMNSLFFGELVRDTANQGRRSEDH